MAIQKFKLYICQSTDEHFGGKISVNDFNLTQGFGGRPSEYVLLGTVDQDIDVPEVDTTQLQVDALEAQIQKERAESQSRINVMLERISKLKCIGHEANQ